LTRNCCAFSPLKTTFSEKGEPVLELSKDTVGQFIDTSKVDTPWWLSRTIKDGQNIVCKALSASDVSFIVNPEVRADTPPMNDIVTARATDSPSTHVLCIIDTSISRQHDVDKIALEFWTSARLRYIPPDETQVQYSSYAVDPNKSLKTKEAIFPVLACCCAELMRA
jgi:hypothetical protein